MPCYKITAILKPKCLFECVCFAGWGIFQWPKTIFEHSAVSSNSSAACKPHLQSVIDFGRDVFVHQRSSIHLVIHHQTLGISLLCDDSYSYVTSSDPKALFLLVLTCKLPLSINIPGLSGSLSSPLPPSCSRWHFMPKDHFLPNKKKKKRTGPPQAGASFPAKFLIPQVKWGIKTRLHTQKTYHVLDRQEGGIPPYEHW